MCGKMRGTLPGDVDTVEMARPSRSAPPPRRGIVPGAWARLESANGQAWSGRVTHADGDLVGLRGSTPVDRQLAERDMVTVVVGSGATLMATQARVLAASGSLVRLVCRESFDGPERERRAVRVAVEVPATVAAIDDPSALDVSEALVVDLSCLGCALEVVDSVAPGLRVLISMTIAGNELYLEGTVVRTWVAADSMQQRVGVQFETLPIATQQLINRFLVNELRRVASPTHPSLR
jgi:PilZ domain